LNTYCAYGLSVQSDIALPELRSDSGPTHAPVAIGATDVSASGLEGADIRGACFQAKANEIWLDIPSVGRLHIRDGRSIGYARDDGADDALLRAFLLGSGLGALLIQRGYTVIHGNAVEMGDGCLMCVGESGVGKSTTATAFLQRGYRVIADDVCPLDERSRVVPGMPHVKVWQDAADALGIPTGDLARIALRDDKFRLPLHTAYASDPLPLRTVVELCPRDTPGIDIETVSGLDKIAMVMRNLYRPEYVRGMGLQAAVFRNVARHISGVAAFRAHRPRAGFELDALLDALLEHCARHARDP